MENIINKHTHYYCVDGLRYPLICDGRYIGYITTVESGETHVSPVEVFSYDRAAYFNAIYDFLDKEDVETDYFIEYYFTNTPSDDEGLYF